MLINVNGLVFVFRLILYYMLKVMNTYETMIDNLRTQLLFVVSLFAFFSLLVFLKKDNQSYVSITIIVLLLLILF